MGSSFDTGSRLAVHVGAAADTPLGIAIASLDEPQQTAALWVNDVHGMTLDLPNLLNMRDQWARIREIGLAIGGQRARGHSATVFVVPGRRLEGHEFNPAHLIDFFATGPGM